MRRTPSLPVRAVIFDLGNVLVPFDHMRACRAAARFSPLTPAEIYRRLRRTDLVERFDRGEFTARTFFAGLRRLVEFQGTYAQLSRAWVEIFHRDPAMERLVAQLAGRCRLVLLSNTNRPHFEYARRNYPVVRRFRRRVLSYRVGLLKPDPEIFRLAVEKTGCAPEECLYVDDMPAYAAAAEAVGVRGIRFRGARHLRAELALRGLHLR